LNRCFVIGIDESEEQTQRIHEIQRRNYTIDGFLHKREIEAVRQKHVFAQRLLKPVQVFNQFAEYLTFPSSTLRSRRDNDKFLRLITSVCFLHQHQRERKALKLSDTEEISYIECSHDDYRIAYELLSEGVLDNTLDDLPRPARRLLQITKRYVDERAKKEEVAAEKIIFERKEIKEYSSWSFSQVRYNLKTLQEYEYLRLVKMQNGLANQYRLNSGYGELDFMGRILSPEELKRKLKKGQKHEEEPGQAC
jgi:DNA primase